MADESLISKLKDVNIGDIVELERDNGDKVAGYVKVLKSRTIKLSHESPDSMTMGGLHIFYPGKGDRRYDLGLFSKYQVLKPRGEDKVN